MGQAPLLPYQASIDHIEAGGGGEGVGHHTVAECESKSAYALAGEF